ncbi:MAG: hypothetical protein FWE54_07115 [Methanimicrococcus sp.]|nr:hypothetical protein [Methanimicrococcus sp.]
MSKQARLNRRAYTGALKQERLHGRAYTGALHGCAYTGALKQERLNRCERIFQAFKNGIKKKEKER